MRRVPSTALLLLVVYADLTLPRTCQECKDHTHRTDALGLRVTCLDAPPCTALVPDTVFTLELPIWVLWDASIVPGSIVSFPPLWNGTMIVSVRLHSIIHSIDLQIHGRR